MDGRMRWFTRILFSLAGVSAGSAEISFNREVRPILAENCFYCHGQDANKRKAGLQLNVPDNPLRPNDQQETAIVPGHPEASALVQRLFSTDPDSVMPPPNSHRHVTPAQQELLKQWILEGGKYESHWAFAAPVRPVLPEDRSHSAPTACALLLAARV